MDPSKPAHPSKAKSPTSMETKISTVPRIPQEIIDQILDHLAADSDSFRLRSCALVSKSWVPSCQHHLFHTILFTSTSIVRWLETFPVPEDSLIHHVRELCFSIGKHDDIPERFFEYILRFTNIEKMALVGEVDLLRLWTPPFWRLPQSVTSLTISSNTATRLVQIRDVMAQLPNLDNLSLCGPLLEVDRMSLLGIGTILKGRFGGKLRLRRGYAHRGTVDMLLEVPTGLHFTEVHIFTPQECLLSTVRFAEACAKTLVKLSYVVSIQCKSHPFSLSDCFYPETLTFILFPNVAGSEPFERSFDLSKFPNLQEVHFSVCWMGGELLWIPTALSTLRLATSPRLSSIQLNFIRPISVGRNAETQTVIKVAGDDLRQAADEVARIEREFGGVVDFTVPRDPVFKQVFDTLNVRFHFCGEDDTS